MEKTSRVCNFWLGVDAVFSVAAHAQITPITPCRLVREKALLVQNKIFRATDDSIADNRELGQVFPVVAISAWVMPAYLLVVIYFVKAAAGPS